MLRRAVEWAEMEEAKVRARASTHRRFRGASNVLSARSCSSFVIQDRYFDYDGIDVDAFQTDDLPFTIHLCR